MSPVLSAGVDTFALLSEPDAAHNTLGYLTVANGAAEAYIYFPITGIPTGATVTSAILTLYTSGSWGITPTVTATPAAASWGPSRTTWNARPGVTGAVTTVTHASAVDGDPFVFDVTAQVVAQRAGGTAYGFVVKRTDALASKAFYSRENPTYPPTLTLTWTTVPVAPSSLSPSGGRAVATSRPTVTLNGAAGVTAVQVQVDATAGTFAAPEFDSGWVTTTAPALDLATTLYAGAASAVDKSVRARYRNASGVESGWSPIAHWMYRAYPTVTFTYPSAASGGVVTSDTPTVTWTTTGTQTAYALSIAPAATPQTASWRTKVASAVTSAAIPDRVIRDSSVKTLTLAVTDAYTREAVAGFPAEAVVTQSLVFQGSLTLAGVD